MVNTEIRWTTFFATKGGEALYSQQKKKTNKKTNKKKHQELTVAQVMNSLLPNSDLN